MWDQVRLTRNGRQVLQPGEDGYRQRGGHPVCHCPGPPISSAGMGKGWRREGWGARQCTLGVCPAGPPPARNKLTGSGKDFSQPRGQPLPSPVCRCTPASSAAGRARLRADPLQAPRSAPRCLAHRPAPLRTAGGGGAGGCARQAAARRPASPGSALADPIDSLQPAAAVIKSHLHPGLLTQSWSANNYLLAHFRTGECVPNRLRGALNPRPGWTNTRSASPGLASNHRARVTRAGEPRKQAHILRCWLRPCRSFWLAELLCWTSSGEERRAGFNKTLILADRHIRIVGLSGFKHIDTRTQSRRAWKCPTEGKIGRNICTTNAVTACFICLGK